MNRDASLEQRLETLGSALRDRPSLGERVMNEIRESGAQLSVAQSAVATQPAPHTRGAFRRRWPFLTAAIGVGSALAVLAFFMAPTPSAGWAEVSKAISSKKWIRATTTYLGGQHGTIWLSPARKLWAYKNEERLEFADGRQRAKYTFRFRDKQIVKLPLGEEEAQRIFPLEDLTRGDAVLNPWMFGTEKIIDQKRREVSEGGKTWIEFQLVFWRGEANQGTLRIDPVTKLPIELLLTSPTDATNSCKWEFDYPLDGPGDIYALGAPASARIADRMPPDECLRALDAIAASHACIGDFRLLEATDGGSSNSLISRKGNRWRVDSLLPRGSVDPLAAPAPGESPHDWIEERLKLYQQVPWYVCDGKAVYQNSQPVGRTMILNFGNRGTPQEAPSGIASSATPVVWQLSRHVAPQDLLSGQSSSLPSVNFASKLFPDLLYRQGFDFEFNPRPVEMPGCLLFKVSAHITTAEPQTGNEWYYVDPAKGYAVVRAELFNLPVGLPVKPESATFRQTIRMEDFRQSPQGFWYPTTVHQSTPAVLGPNPGDGSNPEKQKITQMKSTIRYQFDFKAALPDSLFEVGREQKANAGPGQ
jgi:hypothetical protein